MEIDQWQVLDREGRVEDLAQVQKVLGDTLQAALQPGEVLLPWGRGRFLAILSGAGADVFDRMERVCGSLPIARADGAYTASAVVEPKKSGARSWAAGLQSLENKLFALRLRGMQAQVA